MAWPHYTGNPADLIEAEDTLKELLHRPKWHRDAACRGKGTGLFFIERGGSTEPGKALCDACPVILECHATAEADRSLQGTWGGLSQQERLAGSRDAA